MKISLNWLRDFVDITKDDEKTLIDKLTTTTCELEAVEHKGEDITNVVIGQIQSVTNHPNSEKLHLLTVNVGNEVLDIVCGAPNVRPGLKIPVVKVGGSVIGAKIKASKVGGYISNGMCCGASELGLEVESAGLLELAEDAPVGESAIEYLNIHDTVLEIDNKSLTNRPDLWGHYGFAREVSAILNKPLKALPVADLKAYDNLPALNVKVLDNEICQRYSAIRLDNITKNESPLYIKQRLMYCDMRPINLLADLTNYIMLEIGQPMHAFNGAKVNGIVVKRVDQVTDFVTLDGQTNRLPAGTLVIADENGVPSAVAGVMGGLDSEIEDDTNSLVLESATFRAGDIRRAAAAIGHRTDSSNRYEKTLDPENCEIASARYIHLLHSIDSGARVTSKFTDSYNYHYPTRVITLEQGLVDKYIGKVIDSATIVDLLTRLGFQVEPQGDKYIVTVPSFRATKDVTIPADLVEEIARLYGYENIEDMPYKAEVSTVRVNEYHDDVYATKVYLTDSAKYSEVHSYVFKNKEFIRELGLTDKDNVKILGSLTSANSELRNRLLYSLIEFGFENMKSFDNAKLYEIGASFDGLNADGLVVENNHLVLLHASADKSIEDMYKGMAKDVMSLVASLKNQDIKFVDSSDDIAHPKYCVSLMVGDKNIGRLAVLHPKHMTPCVKRANIVYAEIDMNALSALPVNNIKMTQVSKYQSIDLDISFLVPEDMPFGFVKESILNVPNRILQGIDLVEVYRHEKLGDKKSITVRFTLCSPQKTLSSEDVKKFSTRMENELAKSGIMARY
ncbi:MAG: phenylalanine--tRNA ligase subunit beta [Clostridia bacterium]